MAIGILTSGIGLFREGQYRGRNSANA